MAPRKKSYTPAPVISDDELRRRLTVTVKVLSQQKSVSEAARELGLSRNQYQTLMHRGLFGLIEGLSPKLPGRPAEPETQRELRERAAQAERDKEKLERELEAAHQALAVTAELLRGRASRGPSRQKRTKKPTPPAGGSDDDEARRKLDKADELGRRGLGLVLRARAVGASPATLRRWCRRRRSGERLVGRRGPPLRPSPTGTPAREAEALVRMLHGLVGAATLSLSVEGISRRQAAWVKHETLVAMERERIAQATRIFVTVPGTVRGMDVLWAPTSLGLRPVFVVGDASVPYRTSVAVEELYDAEATWRVLEHDLDENGPPLVYRLDRAKAHDARIVRELLDAHHVLVLHGPPHYPRYYGQLERQNREHRGWLALSGTLHLGELQEQCAIMRSALNGLWRRPSLGGRTAEQVWNDRPVLTLDRLAFGDEVRGRTQRIAERLGDRASQDLAWRLAIEKTLEHHGLLRRELGGWC